MTGEGILCGSCERTYPARPPVQLLHALWHEAQNTGMPLITALPCILDVMHTRGWLTADERELWTNRYKTCPEYPDGENGEHIGGRVWCAYCGDVTGFQTTACGRCDQPGTKAEIPEYTSGVDVEDPIRLCAACFVITQEEIAARASAAPHTVTTEAPT